MSFLGAVITHSLCNVQPAAVPLTASIARRRLTAQDIATPAALVTALVTAPSPQDKITRRQRGLALTLSIVTYVFSVGWLGGLLAGLFGSFGTTSSLSGVVDARILGALGAAVIAFGFAAFWRGGFWLRVFGIAIITGDGQEVSRRRAVARASVVWISVVAAAFAGVLGLPQLALAIGFFQLVALLYATNHPQRGLQDRLAGTFLVPR